MYTETSSCTPANGCPQNQGSLPGGCGALAFPFVAMQQQDPPRYDQREALQQGTLFPGLDLPFHKELRSRFPAANNALSELMALDFAIDELGLYLVTHADDQEVLNLYWKYIALAKEGRARYQEHVAAMMTLAGESEEQAKKSLSELQRQDFCPNGAWILERKQ